MLGVGLKWRVEQNISITLIVVIVVRKFQAVCSIFNKNNL